MTTLRWNAALIGALLLGVSVASAAAEEPAPAYEEGTHYHRLPVAIETQDAERIEVVEIFGYACIHCYRFDPLLEDWLGDLPDDVAFRRVPALFNAAWAQLGRLFYAAEALEIGAEMHMALFEAIHRQGLDLRRLEVAEELFEREAGVEPVLAAGAPRTGDLGGAATTTEMTRAIVAALE